MITSRTTEEALVQYLSLKHREVYMSKKLDREISEAAKKIILTGVLSVAMRQS